MPVVLTYPNGDSHFKRAYIKGFYTDSDYPIVNLFAGTLQLTQTGFDVQIYIVLKPAFVVPSSNAYSLKWCIDDVASQAYYLGTPYLAGFAISLINDPVDFSWRIKVAGSGASGTPTRADLAPLPLYWRPL